MKCIQSGTKSRWVIILLVAAFIFNLASTATAHPLGNFTVNHFAKLDIGSEQVKIRYVVDMAEIPSFQEMRAIDGDGDGKPSSAELNAYAERTAAQYANGITLIIDGARVTLKPLNQTVALLQGDGGLQTLRFECDLTSTLPAADAYNAPRRLRFEDNNHQGRIGWNELFVAPINNLNIFDSSAFGNGLTDELKAYPNDMLAAPLNERTAEFSISVGQIPKDAQPLLSRDGRTVTAPSRDRLAELIAVPELTFGAILFGLLIAFLLGGFHALSPGHGKTIVGAYLVGSRGTARHAAFLGLTVTITHTAGVFALGLITLFASQYVVPERLFPVLSFISGALVVGIGLSLFIRRLRSAFTGQSHEHTHDGHAHNHENDHTHFGNSALTHSHGGQTHSHLPPGADGSRITWRSLLALGISGGILPCPSALVVLLAAIALHRVAYGLLLVVAFSIGLAGVLTGIGLIFLYAGRFMKSKGWLDRLTKLLPTASAFIITCAGLAICYEALGQNLFAIVQGFMATTNEDPTFASVGAFGMLGLGLIYGLKHATEIDHIVAVSAIVSEHRKLRRAALVGGLWGAGHTASLVVVGTIVLALRVAIPETVASWLEFSVALMIIGLGISALRKVLNRRADVHVHKHVHDQQPHMHIHFHENNAEHTEVTHSHSHTVSRIGFKPTIVGAIHGLAGSAALTLLVLTQINSVALGMLYLVVFGLGSIVGMLLMSGLVGLPFVFSSRKLTGIHYGLQMSAGVLSIAFGFWYAYQTGIASGLMTAIASL